jgi:hypothetical protein
MQISILGGTKRNPSLAKGLFPSHKAMAAVRKSHNKGLGPKAFARSRIDHHPRPAKIHLRLAARLNLQPNRHRRRPQLKLRPQIPLHRAIANPKPGLFLKLSAWLVGRPTIYCAWATDTFHGKRALGLVELPVLCRGLGGARAFGVSLSAFVLPTGVQSEPVV